MVWELVMCGGETGRGVSDGHIYLAQKPPKYNKDAFAAGVLFLTHWRSSQPSTDLLSQLGGHFPGEREM